MFDLGWSEIILISAVTLIVIGPKEIPHVLRGCMRFMGKIRGLVQEFRNGVDDVVRQVDLNEFQEYKNSLNDQVHDFTKVDSDFSKDWDIDWDKELERFESDDSLMDSRKNNGENTTSKPQKTGSKKARSKKSQSKPLMTKTSEPKKTHAKSSKPKKRPLNKVTS